MYVKLGTFSFSAVMVSELAQKNYITEEIVHSRSRY